MGNNNMGTLTDTQRKALTEMLGECYHKCRVEGYKFQDFCDCCKCGKIFAQNRTFDIPQDFFDVVRVLTLEQFEKVFTKLYLSKVSAEFKLYFAMQQPDFIERFMRAVAETKEEKPFKKSFRKGLASDYKYY